MIAAADVTIRRLRETVIRRRRLRYEQTVRLMLLGEMAGIVAHKVNNPLAAITNFARGCVRRLRLVDGDGGTRLLIEALEEITEQANRASLSLRQIRNFLQPRDTVYRQVSPVAVVRRAVSMAEPLARSRGVRIEVTVHATGGRPLPAISVDPLQIEQVLVHLLLNGIEAVAPEFPADSAATADLLARSVVLSDGVATRSAEAPPVPPAAGRTQGERVVSVSVAALGRGTVEFTVADDGPGVPSSLRELIFEPFFTTRPKGLGMGLALCRSIIESHRGRLWVECPDPSDGPEVHRPGAGREAGRGGGDIVRGAVFRFTLPGREESASHE